MNKVEFSFTADLVWIEDGQLPSAPIGELKNTITQGLERILRDADFDKVAIRNLKVFEHTEEG